MTGSLDNLNTGLLAKLHDVEVLCGFDLTINSGYRTAAHNATVGGVQNSEHTYGCAVDVACVSGSQRWILVNAAIQMGFVRIGIGKDFVHLGVATDKPQKVIWTYYS